MKVFITGSAGFIGGYLAAELLARGHRVVGLDNFSKYGPTLKAVDRHARYEFVEGDAKNTALLKELMGDCEQVVALAAVIGGIPLFHQLAYDLLAENERIIASTFDAALWAFRERKLKKINVISSSMVFERTNVFPTPEGEQRSCPPPRSTYGFQKLACEYFAQGAYEQYGLPYTIIRPFNAIGVGEKRALRESARCSGNIKLAMSHVVPDLVQKIIRGQDPLHILGDGSQIRHYTYAGDLAEGIRLCMEHPRAMNEDFNLSSKTSTSVLELARIIWKKIRGDVPFRWVRDAPFPHDVGKRVPCVRKAREILGFEANTTLDQALDEIIPWVREQIATGGI